MTEERATGSLKANASARMTLMGCVRPAATKGEGDYILDRVTLPPGEIEPEASSSSGQALIPRGSWVRLGGPNMHQYLGKQVVVSGNLADIATGTAGKEGAAKPGDYVTWNRTPGDVPLFAVETVKEQGDCK
jgi:hypothetical protein